MKFILGKKVNMTRIFTDDGKVIPVTKVAAGPCVVTQVKTNDKDGYQAVQVGYEKKRKITKALQGHFKKLGDFRFTKEFPEENVEGVETGSIIEIKNFVEGDIVKVVGTSKGRGFQGVVKRHGFHGSPASHGHKDQLRMPGSIGATDAARVFKGKRMGGHMGNAQVTVSNLEVVKVDAKDNAIYLKGAVPGARGTLLILKSPGELEYTKTEKKEEPKTDKQKEEKKEEVKVVKKEEVKETKEEKKEEKSQDKK